MNEPKNIFAFSDIHGDIMALIINLRDCANVICVDPNRNISNYNFPKNMNLNYNDDNPFDYFLDYELNKEYNDTSYNDSLGYIWCGNDSHVIIIGDMIDGFRPGYTLIENNNTKYGEYPAEELKILKFINSINKQANKYDGKIVKCAGNHELMAMIGDENHNYNNYISGKALQTIHNRKKIFSYGSHGYDLLMEDNLYVIYVIRDFIFVHGGLTYIKNIKNNVSIDEIQNNFVKYIENKGKKNNDIQDLFLWNENSTLLLSRAEGYSPKESNETLFNNNLLNIYDNFCKFIMNDKKNCKNNIKLIVGHCPQNYAFYGSTFENVIDENNLNTTIGFPITSKNSYTIKKVKNYELFDDSIIDKPIFGITAECFDYKKKHCNKDKKPNMYRVDVGVSRAFDPEFILDLQNDDEYILSDKIKYFRRFYLRKLPQVLHIKYDDDGDYDVTIIRSQMGNMFVHQPRSWIDKDIVNALKHNNKKKSNNLFYGGNMLNNIDRFKMIIIILKFSFLGYIGNIPSYYFRLPNNKTINIDLFTFSNNKLNDKPLYAIIFSNIFDKLYKFKKFYVYDK